MAVIEIEEVYKEYDGFVALNEITLSLDKGLTLLLGPNGAGKTTLLKCIVGLLNFEGEIRVMGYDVLREAVKAKNFLGYLPQKVSIYENMKCYEIVKFFSELRKIDLDVEEVLKLAELEDEYYSKFGELSGGMRQRFALALLLASDLPVLILDEPMSNLDPMGRRKFEGMLRDLKSDKTILVSSHSLGSLLPYADRVVVMNEGEIVFDGELDRFLSMLDEKFKAHVKTSEGWFTITAKTFEEFMSSIDGRIVKEVIFEEIPIDQLIAKISVGGE